ncbi:hypothetical protein [Streptomyces sp. NPDC048242]|uniref:hypothetical protein n=1 Tax=Streptomyces sp. NPDC048242 TaxID=3155026 RepID=UPI0034491E4A
MTTFGDDGPDFGPEDPLAVIMRPPATHLAPPPGRYEEIRRGAARRRILRAAVGAGATCAVAALFAVPLLRTTHQAPATPTVPLAPPPASSPRAVPTPAASAPPRATPGTARVTPTFPARRTAAPTSPSAVPSGRDFSAPAAPAVPSARPRGAAPSAAPTRSEAAATTSPSRRGG